MPLDLSCETRETLTLDEYVAQVRATVDFRDRASVLASAPKLKALSNNRAFLLDHLIDMVQERRRDSDRTLVAEYTSNVFVLAQDRQFAVRAVIWPTAQTARAERDRTNFAYELAHDHNFDFMTVGHYGPGYETDLFEYDISEVVGYPGEKVGLRSIGRWQLHPGRVLFFRRGVDVHTQLPPPATSISLNLIVHTPGDPGPQYEFGLDDPSVLKNIQIDSRVHLIELAGMVADEALLDRVAQLAGDHPSHEVRLAAYQTLGRRRGPGVWEPALRDASALVRHHAAGALS